MQHNPVFNQPIQYATQNYRWRHTKHGSIFILSDILREGVCDFLRNLLRKEHALVLRQVLSIAVGVVDASQTCHNTSIQVKLVHSDRDLYTAGGNNAPAETLVCSEGLHPAEVVGQHGYHLLQYKIQLVTRDGLLSLQSLDFWDNLSLDHHQYQLLELTPPFGYGTLDVKQLFDIICSFEYGGKCQVRLIMCSQVNPGFFFAAFISQVWRKIGRKA